MRQPTQKIAVIFSVCLLMAGCARIDHIGKAPSFSQNTQTPEHVAMLLPGLPQQTSPARAVDRASLWSGGRQSLLGDRRALAKGDIMTVVIEIDEKAEISNDSARSRSSSESLAIPQLLGIPQRINEELPPGATLDDAVSLNSSGQSGGSGSVKRNEKLTLRVAATITDVLPNGVLSISGNQEVRVNFEIRELLVSGFVPVSYTHLTLPTKRIV